MSAMYPLLHVRLDKIEDNARVLMALCKQHSIQVTGVTKCVCGSQEIADAYLKAGIKILGDSRIENLRKLTEHGITAEKWLIRAPMECEIDEVIRWSDASVNSELSTIQLLNECAARYDKKHKVILMADLGDIREGFVDYDAMTRTAIEADKLSNIELYGIGTNLTCFSFVQSDTAKMTRLLEIADRISTAVGRDVSVISAGNSATLKLMLDNGIPNGINDLRLGESLLFGRERAGYTYIPKTHKDAFVLECQIIELKEKPSLPWGTIGVDSYGKSPRFVDRGDKRLKAICALGKQDFDLETTIPEDPKIIILGASSDHLILDVTDSDHNYKVGDTVKLILGYFSTMRAYTSKYVEKVYEH